MWNTIMVLWISLNPEAAWPSLITHDWAIFCFQMNPKAKCFFWVLLWRYVINYMFVVCVCVYVCMCVLFFVGSHHENMPNPIVYTSNIDPLKPHFYMVKLGFTGVYIIFLISAQNIDCGYSLEPPRRGGSNEYPQSMFWADIWKISEIFIWKCSVFGGEIFNIFE